METKTAADIIRDHAEELLEQAKDILRDHVDFDGDAGEYVDPRVEDFMQQSIPAPLAWARQSKAETLKASILQGEEHMREIREKIISAKTEFETLAEDLRDQLLRADTKTDLLRCRLEELEDRTAEGKS